MLNLIFKMTESILKFWNTARQVVLNVLNVLQLSHSSLEASTLTNYQTKSNLHFTLLKLYFEIRFVLMFLNEWNMSTWNGSASQCMLQERPSLQGPFHPVENYSRQLYKTFKKQNIKIIFLIFKYKIVFVRKNVYK